MKNDRNKNTAVSKEALHPSLHLSIYMSCRISLELCGYMFIRALVDTPFMGKFVLALFPIDGNKIIFIYNN